LLREVAMPIVTSPKCPRTPAVNFRTVTTP
jgi:hypothetical protein